MVTYTISLTLLVLHQSLSRCAPLDCFRTASVFQIVVHVTKLETVSCSQHTFFCYASL